MRKLPVFAQIYLCTICCLGLFCLSQSNRSFRVEIVHSPWQVLAFILVAILAGGKKITIRHRALGPEAGSMTLGFAITLTALLNTGPGTATFVAVVACLSSALFPKRQPGYQLTFNVSLAAAEAFAGGLVYETFKPASITGSPTIFFLVAALAALTYYIVNSLGVSIIIGICSAASPFKIWKESFIWAAPGYFATASVTALATSVFQSSVAGLIIFVLPVLYLVYQMYSSYQNRALDQDKHLKEIKQSQDHLAELYLATIKSLALAIDAKDQYTHQHILRVQRYSVAIAKQMGLTGSLLEAVNTGALLHDIGKLGVPEYVLMKPGRLTPDEFEKIKKHPEIGEAILNPVEFPWPVLPVVRSHHEKWDGSGYPDGLKGEDIPLTARIMAVADVYDALTSTRSYRNAWTHEKATAVIKKDAGTHFDPIVVDAFALIIDQVVKEMAEIGEGPLAPKISPAATVIDPSAQAAEDISRTSTELFALYEVTRTLNSSLGSQDTAEYLCRKLDQLYPGSLFAILLNSGTERELKVRAARGLNEDYFHFAKPVNSSSRTLRCLTNKEGYFGEFDQEDLLINAVEGIEWVRLQFSVILPLIFEGKAVGVLNCYHPDPDGFSSHDRSVFENIATQASEALYNSVLFDQIRSDSVLDPLTKLYNLRYLTHCIEDKCGNRTPDAVPEPFRLLCVDIDHFKAINETFGHDRGDQLLQGLASILKSVIHTEDTVARYGSDEFLILLNSSDAQEADRILHQIQVGVTSFETELLHQRLGSLKLSVTIGSASYPEDGQDSSSIVAAAEADLKTRKAEKVLSSLSTLEPFQEKKQAA